MLQQLIEIDKQQQRLRSSESRSAEDGHESTGTTSSGVHRHGAQKAHDFMGKSVSYSHQTPQSDADEMLHRKYDFLLHGKSAASLLGAENAEPFASSQSQQPSDKPKTFLDKLRQSSQDGGGSQGSYAGHVQSSPHEQQHLLHHGGIGASSSAGSAAHHLPQGRMDAAPHDLAPSTQTMNLLASLSGSAGSAVAAGIGHQQNDANEQLSFTSHAHNQPLELSLGSAGSGDNATPTKQRTESDDAVQTNERNLFEWTRDARNDRHFIQNLSHKRQRNEQFELFHDRPEKRHSKISELPTTDSGGNLLTNSQQIAGGFVPYQPVQPHETHLNQPHPLIPQQLSFGINPAQTDHANVEVAQQHHGQKPIKQQPAEKLQQPKILHSVPEELRANSKPEREDRHRLSSLSNQSHQSTPSASKGQQSPKNQRESSFGQGKHQERKTQLSGADKINPHEANRQTKTKSGTKSEHEQIGGSVSAGWRLAR